MEMMNFFASIEAQLCLKEEDPDEDECTTSIIGMIDAFDSPCFYYAE